MARTIDLLKTQELWAEVGKVAFLWKGQMAELAESVAPALKAVNRFYADFAWLADWQAQNALALNEAMRKVTDAVEAASAGGFLVSDLSQKMATVSVPAISTFVEQAADTARAMLAASAGPNRLAWPQYAPQINLDALGISDDDLERLVAELAVSEVEESEGPPDENRPAPPMTPASFEKLALVSMLLGALVLSGKMKLDDGLNVLNLLIGLFSLLLAYEGRRQD